MPRILCVNNYHYLRGGAESVYFSHMDLMQELGWETACFSMRHPDNLPSPWSEYFVDEIEFGRDYAWHEKATRAAKVIYSHEARRQLARLLADFKPDVAHLHNIYHHLSPSILPLLKQAGVPVVLTAHDLKLACPAYRMLSDGKICESCRGGNLLNVVTKRCIKGSFAASAVIGAEAIFHRILNTWQNNIDRVIVPSLFYRDKLIAWGWPSHQLTYIPNYIDASAFQPDFQAGRYFLYFGRLSAEKGIATLIRANAIAGTTLKIAGTGPFLEEARELAFQSGAQVEFMGHQSGEALRALVRGARAVVLPSEWYENAPMSLLEAYASGKPVIGADIGGIPELIIDAQTGWLFRSGDEQHLAAQLTQVQRLENESIEIMGKRCRSHVQDHFSRGMHATALVALYEEVMAIRSRSKTLQLGGAA